MKAPILGLMGGADPGIPENDIQALRDALSAANVTHEIISYPGAPHSFFDRTAEEHAEASADAWKRCLAFIEANTK
jgi:carboxymethylenebutenolidase